MLKNQFTFSIFYFDLNFVWRCEDICVARWICVTKISIRNEKGVRKLSDLFWLSSVFKNVAANYSVINMLNLYFTMSHNKCVCVASANFSAHSLKTDLLQKKKKCFYQNRPNDSYKGKEQQYTHKIRLSIKENSPDQRTHAFTEKTWTRFLEIQIIFDSIIWFTTFSWLNTQPKSTLTFQCK